MKRKSSSTVIPGVYDKLADLLDERAFSSSADVIDAFAREYKEDMKILVKKYGDRTDDPAKKQRGKFYAASTYLADRLSTMKKMGLVELKHTLDFDRERWSHNKRMGTWRLIKRPQPESDGGSRTVTCRVPVSAYEKLVVMAGEEGLSVASKTAAIILGYIQARAS